MNDAMSVLPNHTQQSDISLSEIDDTNMQQYTGETELERISEQPINGQLTSSHTSEQLTVDQISNNQTVLHVNSSNKNNTDAASLKSVINNNISQITQKTDEEWISLTNEVSSELDSNSDDFDGTNNENKHSHTAEQYRDDGDLAFNLSRYPESIDFYTKSIQLNKNIMVYMNRAIAYYQLDNFDACIQDFSEVLSIDPDNIQALLKRASCYYKKKEFGEAKNDLDHLLTIDPDDNKAQNLLNTILTVKTMNSNALTADNEKVQSPSSTGESIKVLTLDIGDESIIANTASSMSIDVPKRQYSSPDHNSLHSPHTFDDQSTHQHQVGSLNDDEDDMALGYEASGEVAPILSDEEGNVSRSVNVSPTERSYVQINDSFDTRVNNEIFSSISTEHVGATLSFRANSFQPLPRNIRSSGHHHRNNDDYDDLYDHSTNKNMSINSSSESHGTNIANNLTNNYDAYNTKHTSVTEAIASSSFGSIIQSWLNDLVASKPSHYYTSIYNRPWSISARPWSLDTIQYDIDKFQRCNDHKNTIAVSKKMLQNGVLDYHSHAEYIARALTVCAETFLKLDDNLHAIQYATEALQYNKVETDTLLCRAKAFSNEKFLLYSYVDYISVPDSNYSYTLAQRAWEKLEVELNSAEGEAWREKLSKDTNDSEQFLTYIKTKHGYSDENAYEWYRTHADQFYQDACFVLAIQFYTYCIELQPTENSTYLQRAACYLNVFEPEKAMSDCDTVLKEDKTNFDALYRKASAYKMSNDGYLHESTLKECMNIQPHNQIILAEYYKSRREPIPRKKRRIRINPVSSASINENRLSYEELEQIRSNEILPNSSLESNDIEQQCSFILHLPESHSFQSLDSSTSILIETMIDISQVMIQAEKQYQTENRSTILPFSYTKFCFDILIELSRLPDIDTALSMIDENHRNLLDELLSYYSSLSSARIDIEQLDRLKNL